MSALRIGAVLWLAPFIAGCEGTARGSAPGSAAEARHGSESARPARPALLPGGTRFLEQPEAVLLDRMLHGRVKRIEKGGGGRSLGFKLTFADGTRAYFKPAQAFSGTNWFAEVVAHYLDRALDIGRVPPVVGRRLRWAPLRRAAEEDRRVDEVEVDANGEVAGALSFWLDAPLERAKTPPGWENWLSLDGFSRWDVTPYQRPSGYAAAMRDRKRRMLQDEPGVAFYEQTPEPDTPERAAELSDMLLLDFLTLNIDRWGGNNGNVLTLGAGGPLIFLDNAAGFSPGPHRRGLMDARLAACQRFRKQSIDALQALSVDALAARMARDPLSPLLDASMLEGIAARRKAVLAHVTALQARHGERVYFRRAARATR